MSYNHVRTTDDALKILMLIMCIATPVMCLSQMSANQARQALLPHVEAPDTTLQAEYVIETGLLGTPEYLFYGDGWGSYRIDAVTGEKHVQHRGRTLLEPGAQPTVTLAATQLRQIAVDYVAAHFPGYIPGLFAIYAATDVFQDDLNEFGANFVCTSASGADLPIWCRVHVEEDTGAVKSYQESSIPITVNTNPTITQAQAIAIGQQWIAQNFDSNPAMGALKTPSDQYQVGLLVDVDALMNEALLYRIPYYSMVLDIDAHTGGVIGIDYWAGPDERFKRSGSRKSPNPESIWTVEVPKGLPMHHGAVALPGRVFLWHKQARSLGIGIRQNGNSLVLSGKGKSIRLPLMRTAPGLRMAGWIRKGEIYVPIATLLRLTHRIRLDPQEHSVTLIPDFGRIAATTVRQRATR